jgi:hypothetical protein
MAQGGTIGQNISVFGYDTLNFDICPIAREEFEKAMTALEGSSDATKVALSRAAMYVDDVFGTEKEAKAKDYVSKAEFQYAVTQSLVASAYNYASGLEVNLSKFLPMHISEIASKLVYVTKNEDKDDLTAYDLLVAKDKVFIMPGVTIPRYKIRETGKEIGFDIVRSLSKATKVIYCKKQIIDEMVKKQSCMGIEIKYLKLLFDQYNMDTTELENTTNENIIIDVASRVTNILNYLLSSFSLISNELD